VAYFLMKLIPPRPTFPGDASDAEMEAMGRHADYIRSLIRSGAMLAAGPVMEPPGSWGLALADVPDADAAAALGERDPVVLSGLGFRWEVHAMPTLLLPER